MELEFTVTETVTSHNGQLDEINYEFEEVTVESALVGITSRKERRSLIYTANITRAQYNRLARQISDALSFDNFIYILRPFIMGFYKENELEQAFTILDKDHSGFVNVDELSSFLPILNEFATGDALKSYIRKNSKNVDGNLTYDEFRTLILKGIGHDIICNHL